MSANVSSTTSTYAPLNFLRTAFRKNMRSGMGRMAMALCLFMVGSLLAAQPALAATWTVNTLADTVDSGACTGTCSLRDAINVAGNGDTINFSVTGTITLTSALPAISNNIVIAGPGATQLTISGAGQYQIIYFNSGVTSFGLQGVTLANASGPSNGGAFSITVTGVTADLVSDVFSENGAAAGAAIYAASGNTVVVYDDTFYQNHVSVKGGAIYSGGSTVLVMNSTFNNNTAANGGAIAINYPGSSATYTVGIANNTFVNNYAVSGGAIFDNDSNLAIGNSNFPLQIVNNIFTGSKDTTASGAAISNHSGIAVTVSQNLYYQNYDSPGTTEDDCYQCTDTAPVSANPQLLAYGYYGGQMQTLLPEPGSPAIGAGSSSYYTTPGTALYALVSTFYTPNGNDERGYPPAFNILDLGADQTNYRTVSSGSFDVFASGSLPYLVANAFVPTDIDFIVYGTFTPIATMTVATPITIVGNPASNSDVTISGDNLRQIFNVTATGQLSLNYLTLTEGYSSSNGAAINSIGELALYNDDFESNGSLYTGGAVTFNSTTNSLIVNNTTFNGNLGPVGAAIDINNALSTSISNSTFSGNIANSGGAVQLASGPATLQYNTFYNNSASYGGAVFNYSNDPVLVANNTFVQNTATILGGAYGEDGGGTTTATNNILALNTTGSGGGAGFAVSMPATDLNANYNVYYHNYLTGTTFEDDCLNCLSNTNASVVTAAPVTAVLANNGGPTQTFLPLYGAVCAGNSSLIPAGITTDQRGFPNSVTYGTNTCYDAGSVQSNYQSVQFTNIPVSGDYSVGAINTVPNPYPIVSVTESGQNIGNIPVTLTDASSTVTGLGPVNTVAGTGAGFSSLEDSVYENTTLSATLPLTSTYSLTTATTAGFDVIQPTVNVTVTTEPGGLEVTSGPAGGSNPVGPAPVTQTWTIGSQYEINALSPQYGTTVTANDTEYVFTHWSGSGGISTTENRILTASTSTTHYTAHFDTSYLVSVTASAGGSATPVTTATSYYGQFAHVNLTAVPNAGYYFTGWSESRHDIANTGSASTELIVRGPETIVANFAPIPAYVVTTLADSNDGGCSVSLCSLRDAITAANGNNGGAGTITFAPALTGTITLTSALPELRGSETITGPGANVITVSGANTYNVLRVNYNAVVTLNKFTVANGATNFDGAGLYVNNGADVLLNGMVLSGNKATRNGGAIYSDGAEVLIEYTTLTQNSAANAGAFYQHGSVAEMSYVTIAGNTATGTVADDAGAIYVDNNGVSQGLDLTISGNTSAHGVGGVYNGAQIEYGNSIFSGNTGAVAGAVDDAKNDAFIVYSLFNGNTGAGTTSADCYNCQTNTNEVTGAALLSPLTLYHDNLPVEVPEPGSAAICAGSTVYIYPGFTLDERGAANTTTYNGNNCVDLGAVQTHYGISFTTNVTSPTYVSFPMTPAPVVTVTDNGNPYQGSGAYLTVTDSKTDLSSAATTNATSVPGNNAAATFSNLVFANPVTGDQLTAALALNSNITLTTVSSTFNVTLVPTTTSLSTNLNPAMAQNPITLTSTVASVGTGYGTPTGTVNFYANNALLGSGTLSNGTATYVVNAAANPTQLAQGNYTLTATYVPGSNSIYAGSSGPSTTLTQVIDDFSFNITITSVTVEPGGQAVVTFTVTPVNASSFPAPITLSLSGLPGTATYSFSPATIAAGSGTQIITLTINTQSVYVNNVKPINPSTPRNGMPMSERLAPLALGLLLLPFSKRMRNSAKKISRVAVLGMLVVAGIAATMGITGCGAGRGYFSQPVQSYTVTLTGTSGTLSHSTTFTVTVE